MTTTTTALRTERLTLRCPNCGQHDGYTVFLPTREDDAFYCEYCEEHFYRSDLRRPTYPGSYEYDRAELDG
jgi:uncharacterized protein (DUF983 family)